MSEEIIILRERVAVLEKQVEMLTKQQYNMVAELQRIVTVCDRNFGKLSRRTSAGLFDNLW
jgi:hypothetical protein